MDHEVDAIVEVLHTCAHILRRLSLGGATASDALGLAADELQQAIGTLEARHGDVGKA